MPTSTIPLRIETDDSTNAFDDSLPTSASDISPHAPVYRSRPITTTSWAMPQPIRMTAVQPQVAQNFQGSHQLPVTDAAGIADEDMRSTTMRETTPPVVACAAAAVQFTLKKL